MPSLSTLARGALVAAAITIASPAPTQDIGSVIVLPDVPLVLPVLSSYIFPADPRSGNVLTQRANNNRDSATYVPGLNSNTVLGFRRMGFMPTSGSDFAQGHNEDGSAILTQPLYAGSALVRGERQPVVLFVSMRNFVYAYSARIPFNLLWSTRLGEPYESDPDVHKICDTGLVGTEATPVVDLPRNRIIVSFMISDATHHIAALDLNDGHVIPSSKDTCPRHFRIGIAFTVTAPAFCWRTTWFTWRCRDCAKGPTPRRTSQPTLVKGASSDRFRLPRIGLRAGRVLSGDHRSSRGWRRHLAGLDRARGQFDRQRLFRHRQPGEYPDR